MAYTPKTWVCGETITDAGLNNIETGIQEALAGGGSSLPEVTSADDGKVLTVVDGEWAKAEACDCGFECEETTTTILEESVTTTGSGNYASGYLSTEVEGYDSVVITFNGTEYVCPKGADGSYGAPYGAGGYDWSEYPFAIYSGTNFDTQTAGTYSVKVETVVEIVNTTNCFEKAVKKFGLKNIKDASNGGIIEGCVSNACANIASGLNAHAEGGYYDGSEGSLCYTNEASGNCSHAEGQSTTASGQASHSEGIRTTASGDYAHAEGEDSTASGEASHAEGIGTTASGMDSHAEGNDAEASGDYSHAEGSGTIANHRSQHVFGEYNIADPSSASVSDRGNYVEIIGNGTYITRSNARTLDWNGNEVIAGTLSQSSDKRLKEHIEYLGDDAVEFVKALKPAHYTKDEASHVGFYAQDVAEADKWDCMTGEMNGYMTLGYTELIAPLVAYCQHLEKRIEELENK